VPFEETLARVDGVLNAVEITGDFVGEVTMIGRGAGGDATASAVVADLVDLARGVRRPAFGIAADMLL
jgi:homoserine dehydrogenase